MVPKYITKQFYESLQPKPRLCSMDDFQLTVRGPGGTLLPYIGYVKTLVTVPIQSQMLDLVIPMLVMTSSEFNSAVPVLLGTNVINRRRSKLCNPNLVPKVWETAFMALQVDSAVGTVRSTSASSITLLPFEVKKVSGFVRKRRNVESAVTESTENVYSCNTGECPRVFTLNKSGKQHGFLYVYSTCPQR